MSLLTLAWTAFIPMSVVVFVLWIVQLRTRNAGTVDVAWAFGTGAVGVWFALAGPGEETMRQMLVAAMSAFWGIRLGSFLFKRVGQGTRAGSDSARLPPHWPRA